MAPPVTDASPPAATPPLQVTATAPALQQIDTLRSRHGPVLFHQSGGCCDGSTPICFAVGDYIEGPYPATLEGAVLSAQAVDFAEGGRSAA